MGDRVLIAGGAGFLGFHLARRLLVDEYEVDLLDNFARGVQDSDLNSLVDRFSNARLLRADFLSIEDVKNVSNDYRYIFNMAAIVGVKHVMSSPYKVLVDNLNLAHHLIEIGKRQKNLERFFFPSTSEVNSGTLEYFDLPIPTPEDYPLTISNLKRPRTSYMLSKIVGECLCHYSDLPFTIFRPHNIYGPRMGMSHVIPEQLKKAFYANTGDKILVASPDHTRCFCFVDDAIEQLIRMMKESRAVGETLNLGAQDPEVTILETAKICHATTGKKVSILEEIPSPGSPRRRSPDMSKTFSIIGGQSQIGLSEGIQYTYKWYLDNVFSIGTPSAK